MAKRYSDQVADEGPDFSFGGGGGAAVASPPPAPRLPGRALPASTAFNPNVQGSQDDIAAYKRVAGHRWLMANPGGDPSDFEASLLNDPEYKRLLGTRRNASAAVVEGLTPEQLALNQATVATVANTAGAIKTDAAGRTIVAQGQNARDTGQGEAFRGQGKLATEQANRVAALTPSEVAVAQSDAAYRPRQNQVQLEQGQATASKAGADATVAQQDAREHPNVIARNAQRDQQDIQQGGQERAAKIRQEQEAANLAGQVAKEYPTVVQNQQDMTRQDRELKKNLTQSEVNKNNRNPITGMIDGPDVGGYSPAPAPDPAPAPAEQPGVMGRLWNGVTNAVSQNTPLAGGTIARAGFNLNPAAAMYNIGRDFAQGYSGTAAAQQVAAEGPGGVGAAPPPALSAAAPPSPAAPAQAPQRRRLRDGRIVEFVGNQAFIVLPNGQKVAATIAR